MTPMLDVRSMRIEDLAQVRELVLQLGYETDLEQLQARFLQILERSEQALFVAIRDDHVTGWLHAQSQHTLDSGSYVEIMGLVVAASDRRTGMGRALLERAVTWARDLGYMTLRVRSNVQRLESHEFYLALGFRLTKTQHTYKLEATT